jgi:hypothetical protein
VWSELTTAVNSSPPYRRVKFKGLPGYKTKVLKFLARRAYATALASDNGTAQADVRA